MLCDIEVQDTPTVVTDDEKAKERAEGDRRNSEEVHPGNRLPVITEKGKPVPGWLRISRRPFHPTRDRSLRDIRTKIDEWRSRRACQAGRRVVDVARDSRVGGSDGHARGEPAFRGTNR